MIARVRKRVEGLPPKTFGKVMEETGFYPGVIENIDPYSMNDSWYRYQKAIEKHREDDISQRVYEAMSEGRDY